MTTDTPPPLADAEHWARHSLRIDDVNSAPSTAELLRRVTEWEYVVSPETADAVQLLANPEGLAESNITALATQRGCEQRWEALVADFTNEFFDLTPDQRGQRWQFLMDECREIPRLVDRLCDLSLGVEIAGVPTSTDDLINELVQACCKIFIALPPTKIRMRQDFMAMCRADPHPWEAAAQELQSTDADFVSHIAPWVDEVASLRESDERMERANHAVRFRVSDPKTQQPTNRQQASQFPWWWIVVVALSALSRCNLQAPSRYDHNNRNAPGNTRSMPYNAPTVPKGDFRRVPSPEQTPRPSPSLIPLINELREAERKRGGQKRQDSEGEPAKSVPDGSAQ